MSNPIYVFFAIREVLFIAWVLIKASCFTTENALDSIALGPKLSEFPKKKGICLSYL